MCHSRHKDAVIQLLFSVIKTLPFQTRMLYSAFIAQNVLQGPQLGKAPFMEEYLWHALRFPLQPLS